jgi:Large polyvalent protein associated domain 39
MPTIAELRAANPWAEDISDLELLDYRAQQTGTSLEDAAKAFGVKYTPQRNAFTAGLSSGVDQLQGLGYGVLGAGARAIGLDSAAEWADKNVRLNNSEAQYNGRPDLENIEDQTLGSMPGYLVYQGAKQLPMIGGTIAASAAVPQAVIPAALSRGLAFAPRAIGGGGLSSGALQAAEGYAAKKALTNEALAAGNQFARIGATSYPLSVGSLYNEAVERGDPTQGDALAAFAGGVPYAAGEAIMPAIVNRGLRSGGLGFTGNLPTRMGKAAGVNALGEASTELFQNELEMGFAGPLTDDEVFSRRLNSAVAGGLVGGMYGAPSGIRKAVAPGAETDLLGLPSPVYTGTPSDQLLMGDVSRANDVAAAERANRDLWASRQAYDLRDIPVGTQMGLPLDGGQMGEVDPMQQAAAGPLPAEYDLTNPARNRRQMDLVFPETPEIIYGNQFNPASQPGSTGQQAGAFTQLPVTDEIRTPPGAVQQAVTAINGTRTVAQLKATADQALANNLITPDQHVDYFNTLDTSKKLKLVDKRNLLTGLIEGNVNGAQTQKAVSPAAGQQATSAVANPTVTVVDVAKPEQVAPKAVQTPTEEAPQKPSGVDDLPRYKAEMGRWLTSKISDEELQTFIGLNGLRGEDGNAEGYSTRALSKEMGVSHVTVFNRANAAKEKVDAAAKLAGIDLDTAYEILGLGSDVLDIGTPTAAYENGIRTVRADSDDFEDSFGYSRDEALGENEKGGIEDAYEDDQSDQNAVGSAEFEQVADRDAEREDYARKWRDHNGDPIKDVDVQDAAEDYNDGLTDGDVPFERLSSDDQLRWVKVYIAGQDGKLKPQQVMRSFSEIADAYRTNTDTGAVNTEKANAVGLQESVSSTNAREVQRGRGAAERADADRVQGEVQGLGGLNLAQFEKANSQQNGTSVSINEVEQLDLDEISAQFPVVGETLKQYSNLGIESALDSVNVWAVTDQMEASDGIYERMSAGRQGIMFSVEALTGDTALDPEGVIHHEVAHAIDLAGYGGVYSSQPEMLLAIENGVVKPVGKVAREMFQLYNSNPVWKAALEYPFNAGKYRKLATDSGRVRTELFAQLWSAYMDPVLRAELELTAPVTANYLSEVLNDVRTTKTFSAKTEKVAERRAVGFAAARNPEYFEEFVRSQTPSQGSTGGQGDQSFEVARGSSPGASKNTNPSTPDGFFAKLGAEVQDLVDDPKAFFSRVKLGWMTLEQIADRIEKLTNATKAAAVKKYVNVMTAMQQYSKDMVYQAAKIDQDWAKLNDNVQKNLSEVMRTATRMSFDPAVDTPADDAQGVLQRKYNALPPTAKEVYTRVRDHYQKLFDERKAIMMKAAESGTMPAKNKAELESMLRKYRGPYFPLMRLGNWYAVGMSRELSDLQEKVDAGDASAEETKRYEALRKDKANYITKSFNSRTAARRAQKELAAQYDVAYFNTAKEQLDTAAKSVPDLSLMQDYLTSGLPSEARNDMKGMLAQMYFDLLPEQSALKRMMKREGIYGEEEDMRKVFSASTISMSHHVSRLKYSSDMSAAMQDIRKLTKQDEQMTNVYNELVARSNLAMKMDDTPFADRMTQLSYLANLGISPAFILTNMSQVPMITAPWLGARYGFGNTRSALSSAFVDATRIIKGTIKKDGWQAEYDWNQIFKEGSGEDGLLKALLDMNLLDITMEHDLGAVSRSAKTKTGKAYDTFIKASSLPVRVTEVANRLITGLSAYRLEMAKLQKEGKLTPEEMQSRAVDMAAKAVSETQLNYSALNAPRYMQSVFGSKALAKLMFQFRKYQQGMVYLIGKSAADAFKGDKEAAKTLFGLMATTGVMAGATGLPFAGSVFWLATAIGSMFDDDDEPFDAEVTFANYLAETLGDEAALAVRKGLPTLMGVDLSNNVGMATIGMPLPFIRNGNKPSENMSNMLAASAGASFQTVQTIADGIVEIAEGEFAKGVEKVTPIKGAKNIMKAIRYWNEGMTDSKGNVILPSEQFTPWDLAIRGAGFSTTMESEYYDANSAMQNAKQAATDTRQKLLRDFAEAQLSGTDVAEFKERIADFNTRHPEKGVRIDQSSLLKAVQQRKRMAQERTPTGLRKDKAMRPYLDRAAFADGE